MLAACDVFEDQAVRSGIKWVLAGTLSLFFALLIKLEHPSWAVATAFLCMMPRYVGASGEKMVLRICGALAGAMLGYLITGSLQQSPVLFLLAMGTLVATCTMMAGGTLIPYGFYQCAYTATIVAAQGLLDPQMSWRTGMDRCEEIVLGIVVTMIVTSCLWPRYARQEFLQSTRATVRVLEGLFQQRVDGFLTASTDELPNVFASVGARISNLQKMVRLGVLESAAFRRRQPQVEQVVAELGILSAAIANFGRTLPKESIFRDYVEPTARQLHRALAGVMESLASGGDPSLALAEADEFLEAYRLRIEQFRRDDAGKNLSLHDSLEHSGYAISICEIHASLTALAGLLAEIASEQHDGVPTLLVQKFTWPRREWIFVGLRGGLAVVIGLFLTDWFRPPGGDMLVVGTFLFAGFVLHDTQPRGDLRVFDDLVRYSFYCLVFFLFLLLATPLMSSYAVMNLFFGALLFFCGYFFERGVFRTFEMFFLLLVTLILVGVNAQEPVEFQSISGPVLGLWLSLVLSCALRRLVWPARPQQSLHTCLGSLREILERIARDPSTPVSSTVRAKVVFLSAEALNLVGVMENLTLSPSHAAALREEVRLLSRLGSHLMSSTGVRPMPPASASAFAELRSVLFAEIADQIAALRASLSPKAPAPIRPLQDLTERIAELRLRIKADGNDGFDVVLAIGSLYRLQQAAIASDRTAAAVPALRFSDVFSDRVL